MLVSEEAIAAQEEPSEITLPLEKVHEADIDSEESDAPENLDHVCNLNNSLFYFA